MKKHSIKNCLLLRLRVGAEDWTGRRIELAGTSIYGIRRYSRGAWLLGHLDHLRSVPYLTFFFEK